MSTDADVIAIPFGDVKPAEQPTAEDKQAAAEARFGITHGTEAAAWKALIYGTPGVGKSTLGTKAPAPLFLNLENGLARVDCAKTKHLRTLAEVKDALRFVYSSKKYQTAVIDTADELEKMLAATVLVDHPRAKTIADIPYGRGSELLLAEWREMIAVFDSLNLAGKNVLLIGHEQTIKFENPSDANFDFWSVNLNKKAVPVVVAKLDAVLFARYETLVKGVDDDKGKAVTTGRRILMTNQGGSWNAKNRFGLDNVIAFDDFTFDSFN